jgi:hypothetical protein
MQPLNKDALSALNDGRVLLLFDKKVENEATTTIFLREATKNDFRPESKDLIVKKAFVYEPQLDVLSIPRNSNHDQNINYVIQNERGEVILAPGRVRVMTEEEEVLVRDFAAQHFANRALSEERKAEKDKEDQAQVEETVKPMKDRSFERKIEERGKESPTKAASKRAYATLESDIKREERRTQELGQIRKVKAQRARFLEKMVDKDEKIRESKSN